MTVGDQQSIDAWTGYWRSGQAASCLYGSDMEVRLTRVWNECVDELPDCARLLDLATGNGTVARICCAHARTRNIRLQIDAVDAAAIDPPKHTPDPDLLFNGIRFHGGVRLEDLPFADATFAAVVSQFGFEYATEEQAVSEAVRVLDRAGQLRFCIHARDGAVTRDIGIRLERLRSVLTGNGPVALVLALARAAESGDQTALSLRSRELGPAAALVRRLADRPPSDDAALYYSGEFLNLWAGRDRYQPSGLRRSLEEGFVNATGVAIRQEQMLKVARTLDDMAKLGARLSAAGLRVDNATALFDEQRAVQIGWLLCARKP